MKLRLCGRSMGLLALAGTVVAGPVWAHHSFNAYDMNKRVRQAGVLKEFRWGAPHTSLRLVYMDHGKEASMSVVTGSPLAFSRQGFKPKDFRKGDKVVLVYHPNINGTPGGALATLTLADGRTFDDSEAAKAIIKSRLPATAP